MGMGKKNRIKKNTVHGCVEGEREENFLNYLIEVYQPDKNNIHISLSPSRGGKPDSIVKIGLETCDRNKSFVWLDEDFEPTFPLGREIREKLAKKWCLKEEQMDSFFACPMKGLQQKYNPNNRNPILIISQPVCVESFILQVLGHKLPYECYDPQQREKQIKGLKNKFNQLIGKKEEAVFYKEQLPENKLEKMRKTIPELNLLVLMITK